MEIEGKWFWQEWVVEHKTAVSGESGRRQQRETEGMSHEDSHAWKLNGPEIFAGWER